MIKKWIKDHALDSISISDDEFKRLHMCEFKPDVRINALNDRLTKYYRDTEHLDNKAAMTHWKEFKSWATRYGYTQDEINIAKRNNQFIFKSEMRR